MYHICPTRCQTQFIGAKRAAWRDPLIPRFRPKLAVELAAALLAPLFALHERDHLAFADGLLDLGEAEHHLTGLIGQRQSA